MGDGPNEAEREVGADDTAEAIGRIESAIRQVRLTWAIISLLAAVIWAVLLLLAGADFDDPFYSSLAIITLLMVGILCLAYAWLLVMRRLLRRQRPRKVALEMVDGSVGTRRRRWSETRFKWVWLALALLTIAGTLTAIQFTLGRGEPLDAVLVPAGIATVAVLVGFRRTWKRRK